MGKLTDILNDDDGDDIRNLWDKTKAAGEFSPLPAGEYVCHITSGELETSRTNKTPGYKLTFKVIEGDYSGRQFWYDIWLTPAALPMAKRDLGKLGIETLEALEVPLPPNKLIRCQVTLALRRDDAGSEFNRVRRFDVLGIDEPKPDEFAPDDDETSETDDEHDSTENES